MGWTFSTSPVGDWKNSVRFATTTALPAYTVSNGGRRLTANANGAFPITDSVTPVVLNRVLVKDETAALMPNNGIFLISQLGTVGTPWILDRTPDAATASDLTGALVVMIEEGGQGEQIWTCINDGAIVIGTTDIVFASRARTMDDLVWPRRYGRWQKAWGSTTLQIAIGNTALALTVGVATRFVDATGDYIDYETAAGAGSVSGWDGPGYGFFERRHSSRARFVIKTGTAITGYRIWITFATADISGTSDGGANSLSGFRFDSGVGDVNWMRCTKDAITLTAESTGVAVVADTRYEVEVEFWSGGVRFWINSVYVGNISVTLPALATTLGLVIKSTNLGGVARSIRISHVEVEEM